MSTWVERIDKRFYPATQQNWDDDFFRQHILAVLRPEATVLDLGAGAGIVRQMDFRGHAARICGIDLDPRVEQNAMLDEAGVADAAHIPYSDGSFDVVFADNVLEHLPEPEKVFCEINRVLKPGGSFLFKTPNKWHYMPFVARFTPQRFHRYVNRLRGRAEVDTFPTCYRANTPRAVLALGRAAGLDVVMIERIENRPEYLRMTWPTYLVGLLYERVVNSTDALGALRVLLVGRLVKPRRGSGS